MRSLGFRFSIRMIKSASSRDVDGGILNVRQLSHLIKYSIERTYVGAKLIFRS